MPFLPQNTLDSLPGGGLEPKRVRDSFGAGGVSAQRTLDALPGGLGIEPKNVRDAFSTAGGNSQNTRDALGPAAAPCAISWIAASKGSAQALAGITVVVSDAAVVLTAGDTLNVWIISEHFATGGGIDPLTVTWGATPLTLKSGPAEVTNDLFMHLQCWSLIGAAGGSQLVTVTFAAVPGAVQAAALACEIVRGTPPIATVVNTSHIDQDNVNGSGNYQWLDSPPAASCQISVLGVLVEAEDPAVDDGASWIQGYTSGSQFELGFPLPDGVGGLILRTGYKVGASAVQTVGMTGWDGSAPGLLACSLGIQCVS